MGSPAATATKSRQPEVLKVPTGPEKKVTPKKTAKTPTSPEAGLATLKPHTNKTIEKHKQKNEAQKDLLTKSSEKIQAVQKETTKYWSDVGKETKEYWSQKGKEAGNEWYEVVNTPAAKMAIAVVGIGILAWGTYKVLNWVREQGDTLFEELNGWKNGLTVSSLLGITGLATWKRKEIAEFAGKFFNLSPDVLMWLNKGDLKKVIETIYSEAEPTAKTKEIAKQAKLDAKTLELNKDEDYEDFIQNKKSGWQTFLENMGQYITGHEGNVPVTAEEKKLRDYLKNNPPPKSLKHGATVLQAVRLATGDISQKGADKENEPGYIERAVNGAVETVSEGVSGLASIMPLTIGTLNGIGAEIKTMSLPSKKSLEQLWHHTKQEGGKAIWSIDTPTNALVFTVWAGEKAIDAYTFTWELTTDAIWEIAEILDDPKAPWWRDPSTLVYLDSGIAGAFAAGSMLKSAITRPTLNPIKFAGRGLIAGFKGATIGQYRGIKTIGIAAFKGKDALKVLKYQRLQFQLGKLTLAEAIQRTPRWLKNPLNKAETLDAARGKYFARRSKILKEMKDVGAKFLSKGELNALRETGEHTLDMARHHLKEAKILKREITDEMIEKLGYKENRLAKLARMKKNKALVEKTARYAEKTLETAYKAGGKTAEIASKTAKKTIKVVGSIIDNLAPEITKRMPSMVLAKTAGAISLRLLGPIGVALSIADIGYAGYLGIDALYQNHKSEKNRGTLKKHELVSFLAEHPWNGKWEYANSTQQWLKKNKGKDKSLKDLNSGLAIFRLEGTNVKQMVEIKKGKVSRITLYGRDNKNIQQNTFVPTRSVEFEKMVEDLKK